MYFWSRWAKSIWPWHLLYHRNSNSIKKNAPRRGRGYTVLPLSVCPSFRPSFHLSVRRPSVQDIFRRIFLSNYLWQKSDIWSQASYRYPISWEAFLDPDTPALRQTGSRNLTGQKTLPNIWGTYMKLVTKYQISATRSASGLSFLIHLACSISCVRAMLSCFSLKICHCWSFTRPNSRPIYYAALRLMWPACWVLPKG
jgi:hypothetical protein